MGVAEAAATDRVVAIQVWRVVLDNDGGEFKCGSVRFNQLFR
jgi:hypothetical protein